MRHAAAKLDRGHGWTIIQRVDPLFRRRAVVVAGACVLLVAGFAMLVFEEDDATSAGGLAPGQIYSTDDGDPIDVFYALDESGMGCISLGERTAPSSETAPPSTGGIVYGGRGSCVDPEELETGGTYKLVIPESTELPAVVVGVMPAGATGATVSALGWKTARAETRGQWFLASLESADPDPYDLADIRVRFDY
jgi:hypothetical protein